MENSIPKNPKKSREKRQRYWMLIFLVSGIGLTVKGGYDAYSALRSYFWESTEGRIVSSTVTRLKHPREAASYYADIKYEYEVAGETFLGDRVFWGEYGTGSLDPMQEIVDRYPVGKKVTVYYDPANPKKAVLERGARLASFGLFFIGLLFSVVGLGGFILWDQLNAKPPWLTGNASSTASAPKES